ncbi:hypothetical protein H1O16_gp123 [Burkholderia phage BcepSaruman]|uniref:Uncharacterized protein n=1 Tax=Burkholderia phage BcepSaruman TaxID=2530032 RepID=A0A4D5ZDB6_9CAUD|nr:hypothetical protein H1O16_gp123 [Burkholderia phage BcepSaruman]QBX06536.1 hypothetical protein BcepSaruman_123 [Burkholderia phage BcepSaruman]
MTTHYLYEASLGFVTYPEGFQSHHSHTLDIADAMPFDSYEEAEAYAEANVISDVSILNMATPESSDYPSQYTLYWLDGHRKVILGGATFAQSFTNAGYGAGALRALDFYASGDDNSYTWSPTKRDWERLTHSD